MPSISTYDHLNGTSAVKVSWSWVDYNNAYSGVDYILNYWTRKKQLVIIINGNDYCF